MKAKKRGEGGEEEEKKKKKEEEQSKGMEILKFCMDANMDFYDFWYGSLGFVCGLWVVRNLTLE